MAGRPKFNSRTSRAAGKRTQFSATRQPRRRRGWLMAGLPSFEQSLAMLEAQAVARRAQEAAYEAELAARKAKP